MNKLLLSIFGVLCASLTAFCEVKGPVTGTGAGDDLDQAVAMALENALLNAGARTSSTIEADGEKLVADKVSASNVLYLVSYEVLNHRESALDGVNATVKATFSTEPQQTHKDGIEKLSGEGAGTTAREAMDWALADLMRKTEARLRVSIQGENDEVKNDTLRFEHEGFIDSFEGKVQPDGSKTKALVAVAVYPHENDAPVSQATEISGTGSGNSPAEAIAFARAEALRRLGATYLEADLYQDGTSNGRVFERRVAGVVSDCRITSLSEKNGKTEATVHLTATTSKGNVPVANCVIGEGFGDSEASALEHARRDAILNLGGGMTLRDVQQTGKARESEMQIDAKNYLGAYTMQSSKETAGACHVQIQTERAAPEEVIRPTSERKFTSQGESSLEASIRARTVAVIDAGATITLHQNYRNGVLTKELVEKERTGSIVGFNLVDETTSNRPEVSVNLSAETQDALDRIGFGEGQTEYAALIAARYDALMNGGCRVRASEKYNGDELIAERLELAGEGFVGPAKSLSVGCVDGRYQACVSAPVWTGDKLPSGASMEAVGVGVGSDYVSALASAKAHMAFNGGASLNVRDLIYVNRKQTGVKLEGSLAAHAESYEIESDNKAGDTYTVTIKGRVKYGEPGGLDGKTKVVGWGYGSSGEEAVWAAKADAALNTRGSVRVDATWEDSSSGEPSLAAEWKSSVCLVDEVDVPKVDALGEDTYRARVTMTAYAASPASGNLAVRAHGSGKTLASAIVNAQLNFGLNAGCRVSANTEFPETSPGLISSQWSNGIVFTGFRFEKIKKTEGGYEVQVCGRVCPASALKAVATLDKVEGVGFASTPREALREARKFAVLGNGAFGEFEAELEGGQMRSASSSYSGEAELCYRDEEISKGIEGNYKATIRSSLRAKRSQILGAIDEKVTAYGIGGTVAEATESAKENAVAKIFGRVVLLKSGVHGELMSEEKLSDEGYIESYDAKKPELLDCGAVRVEIKAHVKSHQQEQPSNSHWGMIVVFVICLFVIAGAASKNKGLGFVVALLMALVALGMGHWVLAALLVLLGVGALKQ